MLLRYCNTDCFTCEPPREKTRILTVRPKTKNLDCVQAPVVSTNNFVFIITSCSCICLFNPISLFYFLSFPLRDVTYQIIISCTRLYTFEQKRENDRKDGVWRQTKGQSDQKFRCPHGGTYIIGFRKCA